MSDSKLLSVNDIAKILKVSEQYVRRLISDKKIEAARVGKQWIVSQNSLGTYIKKFNVCIEPDDHPRLSSDLPPIVALSFFSGAMGLDIGMEQGGIKALLACEFNKFCRMTIQKNNPEIALIGDINNYSTEKILEFAKIPPSKKIDVIFGGPPCQAFSTAGTRKALDDARGNVFLRYIEIVESLKPTYVVIENVRGLLSAPYPYKNISKPIKGGAFKIILDRLKAAGYIISFELYNAANFGAPQIRERVVLIGKLGTKNVSHLTPTNSDDPNFNLPKWKTLRDAIFDLKEENQHYINFPEKRLKYYRMLKEGQYWKDLPKEIQREAMGKKLDMGGGKTGFYRRLNYSKPSPTLVTNPTMPATDLCHPIQNRPLSVEEYARIQGFPDSWKICGPILEQYRQIGNAVPIKLGVAIAKTILADMKQEKMSAYTNFPFSRYKNTNEITWEIHIQKILEKEKAALAEEPKQLAIEF